MAGEGYQPNVSLTDPNAAPAAAPAPTDAAPAPVPAVSNLPAAQSQMDQYVAAANQNKAAIDKLSQPDAPARHTRLMNMIQGLAQGLQSTGIGLSAAGASLGSGGREGGAQQVAQVTGELQRQKLAAKQQAMEAKNQAIQHQVTLLDTNMKMANMVPLLYSLNDELTTAHMKAEQETTKAAEDKYNLFAGTGLNAQQIDTLTKGGAIDPNTSTVLSKNAERNVRLATSGPTPLLAADNPALVAVQNDLKTGAPIQQLIQHGNQLSAEMAGAEKLADTQTKLATAAEQGPIGQAKADKFNAQMATLYQQMNPGQELPDEFKLGPDARKPDIDRVNQTLDKLVTTANTQAQRDVANAMREQGLQIQLGNVPQGPLNPAQTATRDAILEGRQTAPQGAALRTPYWQRIMGAVYESDPQWSEQRAELRKDFATKNGAKQINAINTALQHTGTLGEAIDALQNTNVKALNDIALGLGLQIGKTPKATFDTIVGRLGPELATAYSVGTGGERGEIEKGLAAGLGPDILQTNIGTNVKLLMGKVNSLRNQWNTNKGSGMPEFDDRYLTPEARAVAQKWGSAPTGVNPITGATPAGTPKAPAPETHIFNKAAWQAKHPGQDVAPVAAAAQAAGYEVQ